MTTLSAIHFPETTLTPQEIKGQSLLFNAISYIIATASTEDENPLCPPYDPAPLGDDATRFGQLLDELKGNETAFYQGQMSNLALEYLETRDEDTVRDIISAVHGEKTTKKTPEEEKEFEKIWQARLLLKLAEMMRQEEEEVQESFQRIRGAQEDMLGDLKGEEEFQDLFHTLKKSLPQPTPVRIESLIKAWGQLFCQGSETFNILHCFNANGAEPFMEVSEAITGKRPTRLVRLPLPDCSAPLDRFTSKREQWQQDNTAWLTELQTALQTVTEKGLDAVPAAEFSKLAAQWTSEIEQSNLWDVASPTKKCGAPALEIYLLGADALSLVARLCNIQTQAVSSGFTLLAYASSRPNTCN